LNLSRLRTTLSENQLIAWPTPASKNILLCFKERNSDG
jgi:hypothetical protein